MRVLIADDDQLIRKLLQTLLIKLGHEVESTQDGEAALRALDQPDPPPLAILDWVMPGLTGIDVCRRLRQLKNRSRTYVLLLSSKSDKVDVVAGLDAGADDYLVKPFNPMELLARLRVAQRTISYQHELQANIDEMQRLLERYNLLGEMFGKKGRPAEAEPATNPGLSQNLASGSNTSTSPGLNASANTIRNVEPSNERELAALLSPGRLNLALGRALNEIGLADAIITTPLAVPPAPLDDSFAAWSALVMVNEGYWLDLMVVADQPSATTLFETLLSRIPVSEREQLDFLAETFNVLCSAIRNSLQEYGSKVIAPVISRSTRTSAMRFKLPSSDGLSRHRIEVIGSTLDVTIFHRRTPVSQKSLGRLNELDLVAENVPCPSSNEVFLLNQGVLLNTRYIEKLATLAQAAGQEFRCPVIEPSPLAQFFCLGRIPSLACAA